MRNIVTVGKVVIDGSAGYVDYRFLRGERECLSAFVKGDNLGIRVILTDRTGDGTANQSKPDKPDFVRFVHNICCPFFIFTYQLLYTKVKDK